MIVYIVTKTDHAKLAKIAQYDQYGQKNAGWKAWKCEHLLLYNESMAKMNITGENNF